VAWIFLPWAGKPFRRRTGKVEAIKLKLNRLAHHHLNANIFE
jgi:hypothetical protein